MAAVGVTRTDGTSSTWGDWSPAAAVPASCPCQAALSPRDRERLDGLEPGFRAKADLLLRLMAMAGHRMVVTAGRRSTAEQQALYAQGRTAPGPIVTYADGVRERSKHQDGVAMDCAFVDQGQGMWDGPWEMYGRFAEGLGLVWGGSWTRLKDRPHVEVRAGA